MDTATLPAEAPAQTIPSFMFDLGADPTGDTIAREAVIFAYLFGGEDEDRGCGCMYCTGEYTQQD